MYKIVVCNMGYDNKKLCELDGFVGTKKKVIARINELTDGMRYKSLEGNKIEYLITKEELKNIPEEGDEDNAIEILKEKDNYDNGIYLRYVPS